MLLLGYFETMKCLEKYNLPLQTETKGNTPMQTHNMACALSFFLSNQFSYTAVIFLQIVRSRMIPPMYENIRWSCLLISSALIMFQGRSNEFESGEATSGNLFVFHGSEN